MATKMVRQTQFSSGEVSEITWKRTDAQELYLSAAQALTNCEVGTTGLAKKRKGTEFLYDVSAYASANSRMYELIDKNSNYYVLLSAGGHFYVFNAPEDQVQVVTNTGAYVVTGYGTNVVARDNGLIFLQDVVTPYTAADLDAIDYAQDNDSVVLTHPEYRPGRIYVSDYDPLTFAFEYLDIYPLPAYDFNTINYNAYTVALGVVGSVLTFQFTGVGADPGFNNAWIGGQILGGGASDLEPIGYAIITAVSYGAGGGGTVTFTATVQIPFQTIGYSTQGSQYSVKQPAWSSTSGDPYGLGYPEHVLFFQNRLWFGNTRTLPNTVFGSKINQPVSFDVGTGRDTDAIVYSVGQTDTGDIVWLNGGKQLEIYTQNYEFAAPQNENAGLTPSTFSIRQQSSYGASSILKPQTYINDSYFASKTGKALINFHFTGVGLAYSAANISLASSHLVKNPRNRALLRGSDTSQDNFIYYINPSDDTLTAFQFAQEYKLAALTPVVFQDAVTLIDIVTVENEVYILKFYENTETYTIEKFNPDITKVDSYETASMASDGTVTGLERFNGYTVQVVYQNQDFGQYLVEDGEIEVNNPMEIADTVEIGLLYDVEIRPMYPFYDVAAAPFMKNLSRIYVDYYQSLNFYINGKLVPYQNFPLYNGKPLEPKTGTEIFAPVSGWQRFDRDAVVITQTSPFDLQILSIAYQIEMAVI